MPQYAEVTAWSGDPTENTAICTASGDQGGPVLISDGDGGAIMIWEDRRNGNYDVYAQRVNSSGIVQWAANGVAICTASGRQTIPALTSDGDGGAIIAWLDERNGNYDVYAQRVDYSGIVQWTVDGVAICTASGLQYTPSLIPDGYGGAIMTWQDYRSEESYYDIYAQRVDSSGAVQWTVDGVAICTASGGEWSPQLVSDGTGGAIITWSDVSPEVGHDVGHGNPGIYAQRVNSGGIVQWTANGSAICTGVNYHASSPELVSDGVGGAIITWYTGRSNRDIYTQRVNSSGVVQWTANGVAICTATNNQQWPQITSDNAGGAIITWYDNRGSSPDIYAQRVNSSGIVQWVANGAVICTDANYPKLVSDGEGGAIITWYANHGGNYDIYTQRVDSSGAIQWIVNGLAICTAANNRNYPRITSDNAGGAIVTWEDCRNGNHDIYAQRVDSDGSLSTTSTPTPTSTPTSILTSTPVLTPTLTAMPTLTPTSALTPTLTPTSTTPNWRKDLQPGDILFTRGGRFSIAIDVAQDFWTHVGIYIGDNEVIEAGRSGVMKRSISNWDYPNMTCVEAYRVRDADGNAAADFAMDVYEYNQENQAINKYKWPIPGVSRNEEYDSGSWYCSELVWAAYWSQEIDIEDSSSTDWDISLVRPQEIYDYEELDYVGHHCEKIPEIWETIFLGLCPTDVVVTDPDGLTVSKESSEIPGAIYIEDDIDGDGDLDDLIIISDKKLGEYSVYIVPEPGALSTDTVSLFVTIGEETVLLADNLPISDIPQSPYSIQSVESALPQIAPVANAGGPYTASEGTALTLDGTGSHDIDGSIVLYEWDFNGDGIFDSSSSSSATTYAWSNEYTGYISLRVTDNDGLTNVTTAEISVSAQAHGSEAQSESGSNYLIWIFSAIGIAMIIVIGFLAYRNYSKLAGSTAGVGHSKTRWADEDVDNRASLNVRCPLCGSRTSIRVSRKGSNAGQKFYVCNRYPECRGKIPVRNVNSFNSQHEDDWADW